mmetsp:Transcript_21370/g.46577  ORF Transcript_21370/g.46577 Transcript_21370/m.46577 type:complete len:143 (-) Transcript_21370:29-457(-)
MGQDSGAAMWAAVWVYDRERWSTGKPRRQQQQQKTIFHHPNKPNPTNTNTPTPQRPKQSTAALHTPTIITTPEGRRHKKQHFTIQINTTKTTEYTIDGNNRSYTNNYLNTCTQRLVTTTMTTAKTTFQHPSSTTVTKHYKNC